MKHSIIIPINIVSQLAITKLSENDINNKFDNTMCEKYYKDIMTKIIYYNIFHLYALMNVKMSFIDFFSLFHASNILFFVSSEYIVMYL